MREIRPSGSEEGVMSNHDPYSDVRRQNRQGVVNESFTQ